MNSNAHTGRLAATGLHAAADMAALRAAAFRTAKRHSRRVRFLRYVIPALAIGSLVLIVLVTWLDPFRYYRQLPLNFGKLSVSGSKLTMEAPKLSGFTRDKRPYTVTAESAAQDLRQPNRIELFNIVGQVERSDKSVAELRSKNGIYDTKAEVIQLIGVVEIESTGGYKALLTDAEVESRKGHMVSKNPVHIVFPDGTLQANQVEIFDHGAKVVFEGNISMTLTMSSPAKPASAEASPSQ